MEVTLHYFVTMTIYLILHLTLQKKISVEEYSKKACTAMTENSEKGSFRLSSY